MTPRQLAALRRSLELRKGVDHDADLVKVGASRLPVPSWQTELLEKDAGARTQELIRSLRQVATTRPRKEHFQAWSRHAALNLGQAESQVAQAMGRNKDKPWVQPPKEELKDSINSLIYAALPPTHHTRKDMAGMLPFRHRDYYRWGAGRGKNPELVKTGRVHRAVKDYRRAMQMWRENSHVTHGVNKHLPGVAAAGKLRANRDVQGDRAVSFASREMSPDGPYWSRGAGILKQRKTIKGRQSAFPGGADRVGFKVHGDVGVGKGDYVVTGRRPSLEEVKAARKLQVERRLRPMGSHALSKGFTTAQYGAGDAEDIAHTKARVIRLYQRKKKHVRKLQKKASTCGASRQRNWREKVAYLKLARAGHWRKLAPSEVGHDEQGGEVRGKTWVKGGLKPGISLRSHQAPAEQALENAPEKGLILAMGTGTGKTPTSVVLTEKLIEKGEVSRVLVLLPKALDDNFIQKGIKRFTTSSVEGARKAEQVGDSTYVVVGMENFRRDPQKWLEAIKPDMVLADEVHRATNTDTVTHKAYMTARKSAPYFLGLTGSVVQNSPEDVTGLLDLAAGKENVAGNRAAFRKRHTKTVRQHRGGLRGGYVREKTLKDVAGMRKQLGGRIYYVGRNDVKELPPVDEEIVRVPMSKQQSKLIEKAMSGIDPAVRRNIADRILPGSNKGMLNVLSSIQKARGISGSVREGNYDLSLVDAVEQTPKLRKIVDDAVEHIEEVSDGQVVMFTNRVRGGIHELAAGLDEAGIPYSVFSGKGESTKQYGDRHENVKKFLAGEARVILVSPAGVEGLNLNNATLFQLADEHYNPEKNKQAIARAVRSDSLPNRTGDARRVAVKRYHSVRPKTFTDRVMRREPKGSVDEWVHALQKRKDKLNDEVRGVLDSTHKERASAPRRGIFAGLFGG